MVLWVSIFTAIANSLLGAFVILKNPQSRTHQLLSLLSFQIALWSIANYFSLNSLTEDGTLFWIRAVMAITAPMATVMYLLVQVFPDQALNFSWIKKLVVGLATLAITLVAISPLTFSGVRFINGNIQPQMEPGIVLFALAIVGALVSASVRLIDKFQQADGFRRLQLKFFIFGTLLTFFLAVITNLILVVVVKQSSFVVLGPMFSLIFIGSLTYAIIKHKFLDINLLIARSVAYALSVITLGVIFVASFTLIGRSLLGLSQSNNEMVFFTILSIFLILLFQPILRYYNALTINIFYKQPYSSELLLENLGDLIRSTLSLNTLTHQILNQLTNTINVSRAAFILKNTAGKYVVRQIGYDDTPNFSDNQIHNLIKMTNDHLLFFDVIEENDNKMFLRQMGFSAVIPLKVRNTLHGFLVLGGKSSGESYSNQDIEVLEILMPQISVAVQNALSYEEIRRFNVTLKEEVERATADLKKANRNLKHLDKLKDEFVFIATHELKNPVTAMRGYLSMLQEGIFGKVPEKMAEPVDQLQASNEQLVELVNDLLQIARSEAKTLTIKTEPALLTQTVDVVAGNVKPLIEQKKLTFTHKRLHEEIVVMADPQRLKEIINNLLSNAIKYSETGEIRVSYEATETMVTTHVKDQGVGISKEDQKKLFTRFYRVEEEAAKGIPGTGLGLFIVKQLIEKMGGKIWVTSQKGEGSTFSFSLPRVK